MSDDFYCLSWLVAQAMEKRASSLRYPGPLHAAAEWHERYSAAHRLTLIHVGCALVR